jgi:hypothetical protein
MTEGYPVAGQEGTPDMGTGQGAAPGPHDTVQENTGGDFMPLAVPGTAEDTRDEAFLGSYYALRDRLLADPNPTQQELDIGVFVEEIQPQAREAILLLRHKGYDSGNVTCAGFAWDDATRQQMDLFSPLGTAEQLMLEKNGFVVKENRISFRPQDATDLDTIKGQWDWLAAALPDLGTPAAPVLFSHAVAFRDAAEKGTLLSAYMPDGQLNMMGVKNVSPQESRAEDEFEQSLSPDPVAATRERAHVGMYHDLKARLAHNPTPTPEEWNAGIYEEELEPQVRDAVMAMRQKGYNTGSSGFWGKGATEQVIDMATYLDTATKARLAEHGVMTADRQIRFTPSNPTDLASVKATWDLIAQLLPDQGKHAEPSVTVGAITFRYAARHNLHADHLECWLLEQGALDGYMQPLVTTLLHEGRDFGPDVYAASRNALTRYEEISEAARREYSREADH